MRSAQIPAITYAPVSILQIYCPLVKAARCAQSEGIPISRYQMMEQLTTISPIIAMVGMSFD